MNIFNSFYLYYTAARTHEKNLFYVNNAVPGLKIAPFVLNTLIQYNTDARNLLQKKRYPLFILSRSGRVRRCYHTLPISMLKTDESVHQLQKEIQEKELYLNQEQTKLTEQRIKYQTSKKPHLVQQCNNTEFQLSRNYVTEVLELYDHIDQICSSQIEALSEAERLLGQELSSCIEQIHLFYTSIPADGQDPVLLPTFMDLQKLVPLQVYPNEYAAYRQKLVDLRTQNQTIITRLKAQIGI